jgi:hypothetical protein
VNPFFDTTPTDRMFVRSSLFGFAAPATGLCAT